MSKFSASASATILPALVVAAFVAGCGGSSSSSPNPMNMPPPPSNAAQPLGTMTVKGSPAFVNSAGLTVYVFDADLAMPGHTACDAGSACAQNWPPVIASGAALPTNWSTIARSDSSKQLAYNGRPLYTFAFDAKPGDANGDGVNAFGGLWHVARPQASASSSPMPHPSGY